MALAFVVYLLLRWQTVGDRCCSVSRVALLHRRGPDPDGPLHGLPPDRTGAFPRLGPVQWIAVRRELLHGGILASWPTASCKTPAFWASTAGTAAYILPNNPRGLYPRVDEKHLTKDLCRAAADPRAGNLRPDRAARRRAAVSWNCSAIGRNSSSSRAAGSEGRGSSSSPARRPATSTPPAANITAGRSPYHLSAILSGLYSLGRQPDRTIIEQRHVVRHPASINSP